MSTASSKFDGSRLKVQRAYRHIKEIRILFDEFLKTDFCKISVEEESDTGRYLVKVSATSEAPLEIALAFGDAVHCLRVAMDYTITTLVPQFEDWIGFPARREREDVMTARAYLAIKRTLPNLADLIVDTLQPYKGGNFNIWEICTLDNIDKHRMLIPAVSHQGLTGVTVEDENGNKLIDGAFLIGEESVLNAVATCAPMKITSHGKPFADIVLPKGTPFENQSVIPQLEQFADLTLKAIEAIEALQFGEPVEPNLQAASSERP